MNLAPDTHATSRRAWLAVIAVGLATFSVVSTEMLPVGLLDAIAADLGTSNGRAGLMMSVPALLAAGFSPLVVIVSGNLDRRKILCGLLALLALANLTSALATNLGGMLAARTLLGFCIGGIWAIAGGLAARLVPGHVVGLATSVIFGGVAAASVLGVPLGAMIGELAGWRWAFGSMALFSGLVLVLHGVVLPALPVSGSTALRHFRAQWHNPQLRTGLLLTLLLVAGHFIAFTFVRPLLLTFPAFDSQWIGMLLFAYGVAGVAGNFLAGMHAARHTRATVAAIAMGLLAAPLLFLGLGHTPAGGAILLLAWGLAYGGVSVGLMTWMMKAAPRAVEIAAALYVSVFNIGIALGSWAGGHSVDRLGLAGNLWLAAGFAAAALLLALRSKPFTGNE